MTDDFDDEDGMEMIPVVQPQQTDPHPYLEDPIAQRIYAGMMVLREINDLEDGEVRQSGLDFLHTVMRSIAAPEKPVSRLK